MATAPFFLGIPSSCLAKGVEFRSGTELFYSIGEWQSIAVRADKLVDFQPDGLN